MDAQFLPPGGKDKDYPQVKNCRLFLFNDCILLAKATKKSFFDSEQKLKPIEVLDLRGAVVLDVAHPKNEFRVRVQSGVAILQTKNWPEKEAWRSDIMDTISTLMEDDETSVVHHPATLSRSFSVKLSEPIFPTPSSSTHKEKIARTRSQFAVHNQPTTLSSTSTPAYDRNKTMNTMNTMKAMKWPSAAPAQATIPKIIQRRLTRQFTLPQIAELFSPQKFAAPDTGVKARQASRAAIGRSHSNNSFFSKARKNKDPSPLMVVIAKQLRKTQSLSSVSNQSVKSIPTM
jgi:hypothetical protein